MAIETLRPNANGTIFEWLVGPDPDDYTQIDEVVADDDTSYVATPWANFVFHVNLQNTALTTETINNVKIYTRCKHITDNADGVNSQIITVTNGTAYYSANINETLSYANYSVTWGTNPATGNAWGTGQINALQIGMKRIAGWWNNSNYTTQMYVEVDYTAAGGSTFTKSIADTINLSAANIRIYNSLRSIADTEQLSVTEIPVSSFVRNFTDTEQLSEGISLITDYIRTVIETENLSVSEQSLATFLRSFADTENLNSAVNSIIIILKTIDDSLNLSSTINLIADRIKSISDSLNLSETVARLYTGQRSIADSEQLSDSQQTAVTFIRLLTSTENLSGIEAIVKTKIIAIAESLNLSSAIVTQLTQVTAVIFGENLALLSVTIPLGLLTSTQIKALISATTERELKG